MKKMRILLLAVLLLTVCVSCQRNRDEQEAEYKLYFAVSSDVSHGAALETEPYQGTQEGEPTPGDLLRALLDGPQTEGLVSAFPRGVALMEWTWDEEENGNVQVKLSEQYGGLTDISLTLADYSIVLTLAQIEGVESVEITSVGHTANYRSHQTMLAEEAVLYEGDIGKTGDTS